MGGFAAALLALLLLTYASAVSSVMQAQMAFAGAGAPGGVQRPGDAMAGMAMAAMATGRAAAAGPSPSRAKAGHGRQAACPFCAAVAHAPILGSVTPLRVAAAFSFAAFQLVASHGPRGPPAISPHARGPPPAVLTP